MVVCAGSLTIATFDLELYSARRGVINEAEGVLESMMEECAVDDCVNSGGLCTTGKNTTRQFQNNIIS